MANFKNRTLFENDNLPVLRALDADSVDLIGVRTNMVDGQPLICRVAKQVARERTCH